MMLCVIMAVMVLACGWNQESKVPVPSDDALNQAEKTIREVFKEEYGVKTTPAQNKLAKKFLAQGRETKDDDALRYILFREAIDLAARSADLGLLLRTLDELSKGFQVQELRFRDAAMAKIDNNLTAVDDLKLMTEAYLKLAREAAETDQFDLATRCAQGAFATAKKSKETALASRADGLVKSVSDLKGAFEKACKADQALAANPNDENANLTWGEHLCLAKGQWAKGLPFLAKGSDATLKALATKELAIPQGSAPQVEIPDSWWALAEKEKSTLRKSQLVSHARMLYELALPGADGLARLKIERRIAEAGTITPSGTPSQATREGLVAWWKCDEGKGTTIVDSAGAGHDATLVAGVEWTKGRKGSGLKFNGTNAYVSCKAANLPATNAPQTISWWHHRLNGVATGNMIMLSNDAQTAAVEIAMPKGKLAIYKLGGELVVSVPDPGANVWTHGTYVFDGKTHSLYLNGRLEGSADLPPQTGVPTKCEFGRWWGSVGSGYYNGLLDEVRIYDRALSASEVLVLSKDLE